jgi:hypothetical protein
VQRYGLTVIVTDDLSSYKIVAEKLQLGHQVCQFHARRWVGKALKELQETIPKQWLWVLEEIRQLIEVLPPDGNKSFYALWKQLPGRRSKRNQARSALEQLRDLLLRLSQDWQNYCTFQSEPEIPWTNNSTERAIGRMKMRTRTVRGYKSWLGMKTGLMLAGCYARSHYITWDDPLSLLFHQFANRLCDRNSYRMIAYSFLNTQKANSNRIFWMAFQ